MIQNLNRDNMSPGLKVVDHIWSIIRRQRNISADT